MVTLNQELTAFLKSKGASLVGFADLGELDADSRDGFPFGISIAVALNPQIISEITEGPTRRYLEEYRGANVILNSIGQSLEQFLAGRGYRAKHLPATTHGHLENLATKLPHKTVATRAGMGWIGKCALLITREFGSAVRLTNVLTDAPFSCGNPINASFCGNCAECVRICSSPSGKNWRVGAARESFFDAFACQRNARELAFKTLGEKVTLCGRCIAICPWTRKYLGIT